MSLSRRYVQNRYYFAPTLAQSKQLWKISENLGEIWVGYGTCTEITEVLGTVRDVSRNYQCFGWDTGRVINLPNRWVPYGMCAKPTKPLGRADTRLLISRRHVVSNKSEVSDTTHPSPGQSAECLRASGKYEGVFQTTSGLIKTISEEVVRCTFIIMLIMGAIRSDQPLGITAWDTHKVAPNIDHSAQGITAWDIHELAPNNIFLSSTFATTGSCISPVRGCSQGRKYKCCLEFRDAGLLG